MTTVYLIRHAEAEGNIYRRVHGQYDSLLTARAMHQLPCLAARFADVQLDAVYASDLYRARHTAHAIAQPKGMVVHIRRGLRELDMGDWEDLMWSDLATADPENFAVWSTKAWECTLPNGEHVFDMVNRFLPTVQRIADAHPEGTIAIVAHGSAIRSTMCKVLQLHPSQIDTIGWADNTCVAKLEIEGDSIHSVFWNDASHLPEKLSTFAATGWKNNQGVPESVQVIFRAYNPDDADDRALLLDWAHQTYIAAYGSDAKLDDADFLAQTAQMAQTPRAVVIGMWKDEPICLVRLNVLDDSEPELGKVGTFYLRPDYRGSGVNQQMLGHAISTYRNLGKSWLCAYVAAENEPAKGFYRKTGFENRGAVERADGMHYKMCKRISVATLEEDADWVDVSNLDG